MPDAAVRLQRPVGHLRQRVVHALTLGVRGRSVDRRPHKRMPEAHLRTHVQQVRPRRGIERRRRDPQPGRRPPHQRRVADRFRGRDQEQQASLVGQLLQPPQEALLDSPRQREQLGQPEPAGHLRRREPARQLQQRERVAARLGHDPVSDALVEPARDHGREQGARVFVAEPPQRQLRQADQLALVGRLPHSEHDRHRLRQQPARDEPEYLARGGIEPLGVVDQAEQRPLLGDLCQEAERGQRNQEARSLAGLDAEGDLQRELLRLG